MAIQELTQQFEVEHEQHRADMDQARLRQARELKEVLEEKVWWMEMGGMEGDSRPSNTFLPPPKLMLRRTRRWSAPRICKWRSTPRTLSSTTWFANADAAPTRPHPHPTHTHTHTHTIYARITW